MNYDLDSVLIDSKNRYQSLDLNIYFIIQSLKNLREE